MKADRHERQAVKNKVQLLTIKMDEAGQRIDNFLFNKLKGLPKSHVYRIIRKGEVRVNSKRVSAFYKLLEGDKLRIPPVFLAAQGEAVPPSQATLELLKSRILYEDEKLLIINKPCGMSVHIGSTVRVGIIEALRYLYPNLPQLELVHRLDAETSGCLILAKKRSVLREMHGLLREGKVRKTYWTLTAGHWQKNELRVELSLHKDYKEGGKHVVRVQKDGKTALTIFKPLKLFKKASLMAVSLLTGRTHQIRVHAAAMNHPIAGDDRYGSTEFNQLARHLGLKRMFLHAQCIDFTLPSTGQHIKVIAPLDIELTAGIEAFEQQA